ncbi:uncharacterized protein LOC141526935 [Cotesia typhae]|uniref:uncharacterized protein LOC141526935 n=1 Tax=Cotesia typhae TaxID=2053667 RepID=UPI003D698AFF
MAIRKFFLINRENCDRDEILPRKEIYIENEEDGKLVYSPIAAAGTYNDEEKFVIFNKKKSIYIKILANDDSAEKLMTENSKQLKRVLKKKQMSLTPDPKSNQKRKADSRKVEIIETKKLKKKMSDASKDVINSSDGMYCSQRKVINFKKCIKV